MKVEKICAIIDRVGAWGLLWLETINYNDVDAEPRPGQGTRFDLAKRVLESEVAPWKAELHTVPPAHFPSEPWDAETE